MGRFGTLDMMRGLAAMAVVIYHIDRPNPLGYVAVDLFFILSGFVLRAAYGSRSFSVGQFMKVRLIRLYPMFAVGVLVGMAIRGGNPLAFLMLPDWAHVRLYPMNTALWSVLYELIASLGFIVFYRLSFNGWLAFWLSSLGLWGWFVVNAGSGSVGMDWATLSVGLARMTFAFTTGIALHWIFMHFGFRRVTNWGWAVCLATVALTFLSAIPLWLVLFILLPALVYLGASLEVPQRRVAAVSGDISYPLYAIHQPIVVAFGWWSVLPLGFAAWLLDRYYDRPVRRWINRPAVKVQLA